MHDGRDCRRKRKTGLPFEAGPLCNVSGRSAAADAAAIDADASNIAANAVADHDSYARADAFDPAADLPAVDPAAGAIAGRFSGRCAIAGMRAREDGCC
jgi:hypothetical protein